MTTRKAPSSDDAQKQGKQHRVFASWYPGRAAAMDRAGFAAYRDRARRAASAAGVVGPPSVRRARCAQNATSLSSRGSGMSRLPSVTAVIGASMSIMSQS